MVRPLTAEDKKWRAQDDAYSLTQAEAIKADPTRLTAAQDAAKGIVAEKIKDIQNMVKVATPSGAKNKTPASTKNDPMANFIKATNARRAS